MKYTVEQNKTRKQWIIVGVVLLIIAVLGVVLWRGVHQAAPQEKLLSALRTTTQTLSSTEPREGSMVVRSSDTSTNTKLTVNGVGTDKMFKGTGKLSIAVGKIKLPVDAEVVSIDNKTYVKPHGIANALNGAVKQNSGLATYTDYARLAASQLDDEWIEVDSLANSQKCLQSIDSFLQHAAGENVLVQLPIQESSDQDGNAVYTFKISSEQLNTLFVRLALSGQGGPLKDACKGLGVDAGTSSASSGIYTLTFTVSGASNQINKFMLQSDNRSLSIEYSTKPSKKSAMNVAKPEDVMSLEEAQNVLENIIGSPAN